MNLYRHMDQSKVQFDFVKHTAKKCAFDDEILSLGGKIYVAPRFKGYNLLQYQSWWRKHLTQHPEHRIIHGHYFTASKYYFSVCKRMNRITIGHSHTDTYSNHAIGKKIMIHGVENYCDHRLACSEKAGRLLYPHKDFIILNNAIDAAMYVPDKIIRDEVKCELGILANQKVVGVIGSFTPVKNPIGVLEIFHSVHSDLPETKLLWCGDGPLRSEIEDKINELGLKESVILAGVRSDIPRMLQAMDVYIMPSLNEGLPVAGIEAQAAGIPCLFSDNVSQDVAITDCCEFLHLDNWKLWATFIEQAFAVPRKRTYEIIKDAGYDIKTTASWIQEFYLSVCTQYAKVI